MIPVEHILLLAILQFIIGLMGVLLRRAGMVVVVSAIIMLNGVLLAFCIRAADCSGLSQELGMVILVLMIGVALVGSAILYSFYRFRRTVSVDEYDQMRH